MTAIAKKQRAYKRGLWAERLAALYLFMNGYRILALRYKTPVGEIDLVASRGETLAIVEVKARRDMALALESVNHRTQIRIEKAANYFLAKHPEFAGAAVRFDIIAFAGPFSVRHLDNAWQART